MKYVALLMIVPFDVFRFPLHVMGTHLLGCVFPCALQDPHGATKHQLPVPQGHL